MDGPTAGLVFVPQIGVQRVDVKGEVGEGLHRNLHGLREAEER